MGFCRNEYVQQAAWASLVVHKWGNEPQIVNGALDRLIRFFRALIPAGGADSGELIAQHLSANADAYCRFRTKLPWPVVRMKPRAVRP